MENISTNRHNVNRENIVFAEVFLNVKRWSLYFLSKWKYIFIVGIIGATINVTYAYLKPPIYSSKMSFAMEEDAGSGGGLGSALGIAGQFGIDIGGGSSGVFVGGNLIELIKSRFIVEKALLNQVDIKGKKKSLADLFVDYQKWNKTSIWQKVSSKTSLELNDYSRKNFSLQQDSLLGLIYKVVLKSNLTVNQKDKKLSIIEIEIKSENEFFAKMFVEAIAEEVSKFYIETKTKKSLANVLMLQKQTDSVRAELNSAITKVAVAADNTFNLNSALNVNRTPTQKKQIDVQANTVILTELIKNLELAKVSLRKETPLIQIIDRPILPLEFEKPSKKVYAVAGFLLAALVTMLYLFLIRYYNLQLKNIN